MFRRLLIGLILGFIVGGLVAAGLVAGLHLSLFGMDAGGAAVAYLSAAATGVLTGLVAGKPIWASGAKIEAGLKAFFGAVLGAGLMFALRQWVHIQPDMAALAPGQTPEVVREATVGMLPMVSLPLLAALLGGFFELDNTGGGESGEAKAQAPKSKKRVASADGKANGKGKARVEDEGEAEEEEAPSPAPKRAKR
jgi:hypothetical protein